jgi:hypothetical protein
LPGPILTRGTTIKPNAKSFTSLVASLNVLAVAAFVGYLFFI